MRSGHRNSVSRGERIALENQSKANLLDVFHMSSERGGCYDDILDKQILTVSRWHKA